jgi:short-subunit dehydrogenase
VTGASAGIGETFARRVAAQGVNVALVARRGERLRALAAEIERAHGVRTRVVVQDLEADDAADRIAEQVRDLEIGMLVNNAGFSAVGRFDRVPREKLWP